MRNTIKKTMLATGVRGVKPVRIKTVENVVVLDVKFTEHYTKNEKYLIVDTLEHTLSSYIEKRVIVKEYSVKDTEALQVEAYLHCLQI